MAKQQYAKRSKEGLLPLYSFSLPVQTNGEPAGTNLTKEKVIFRRERSDDRKYVCASQAKECLASHAVVFRGARLSSLLSREGTKYEKKIPLAGRRETQRGNWGEWTVHPSLIFDYCWFSVSRHSK